MIIKIILCYSILRIQNKGTEKLINEKYIKRQNKYLQL
jgi:hypothetical protein